MSLPPIERDEASAEFFDAAAREQLLIKQCTQCGAYGVPRQKSCRRCGGATAWSAASGQATLVTWTSAAPSRQSPGKPQRIFGYVELEEGPWIETLLVDLADRSLREQAPLQVVFLHREGSESIPAFTSASRDATQD